jgi:hypothetical protein
VKAHQFNQIHVSIAEFWLLMEIFKISLSFFDFIVGNYFQLHLKIVVIHFQPLSVDSLHKWLRKWLKNEAKLCHYKNKLTSNGIISLFSLFIFEENQIPFQKFNFLHYVHLKYIYGQLCYI